MGGLFTLLIIGLVIYMLFSRNGGMGCYGGHHDQHSGGGSPHRDQAPRVDADDWKSNVIDLKKEDYREITELKLIAAAAIMDDRSIPKISNLRSHTH